MIGITSYGGYIPKLRMDRMMVFQAVAWFAPAVMAVAQGERSVCNWDEDALSMAVEAARDCLTGFDKNKLDAVYLCSTTLPYADRQNSGIVKTALNLKDDVVTADFTSALKSGTTGLITALDAIAGGKKNILLAASDRREAKAMYFYEMWFGDGAAALCVGDENVIAEYKGSYSVSHDFADHYRGTGFTYDYMWEERWTRDMGYTQIIPEAVNGLFKKLGITMEDVDKFIFPCFFAREHKTIAAELGAGKEKVADNMHAVCGETGVAHPFVMLAQALETAKPGDRLLVCGFGQGCDALYFQVTDNITKLAPRKSVGGCLKDKRKMPNYQKWLKFRDLIKVEMGIRAEASGQSAVSALWRKRKMITGLVGNQCGKCGTPQWPPLQICVNPECGAMEGNSDYEFAERPATIMTWTADLLAVSVEPPCCYGIVDFEGGGRMVVDFTDCEQKDLSVGTPVRMSFRHRSFDKDRGFHGYSWKAVPVKEEAKEAGK